jgi:hypothetical protein
MSSSDAHVYVQSMNLRRYTVIIEGGDDGMWVAHCRRFRAAGLKAPRVTKH